MNMQVANPALAIPVPSPLVIAIDEPILQLVAAYRAGIEAFNKLPAEISRDKAAEDKAAKDTYELHYDRLRENPPQIHTVGGAVAALRFVIEEMSINNDVEPVERLVQRTLEFLESTASVFPTPPDAKLLAMAEQLQGLSRQRDAISAELGKTDAEWERLEKVRAGLEVRPGEKLSFLGQYIETNKNTFSPCLLATAKVRGTTGLDFVTKRQIEKGNARLLQLQAAANRRHKALEEFEESSGRNALFDRDEKLYDERENLKDAIRSLPAHSIAGLAVKAKIFKDDYPGFWQADRENGTEVSGGEIRPLIDDILALQGQPQ